MNEKSKAFELIEFVWNNEKTDSYLRVNIAMYEAVKLAIISQMKFNKEDFQNIFSKFSEVEPNKWVGVIPETVCQFSEITDKNGNSIFEHDLILIHESESSYQFTVEVLFHKGMFCYKNKACGFTPLWYVSDRCEVIGNAFDNPELMKEGVQP